MILPEYSPIGFASEIFSQRYVIHPEETFLEAATRVGTHIASSETNGKRQKYAERFTNILSTNRFSPGGRIWRGSGRPKGQLLNCFVLPAEDSREGWGSLLKNTVIISGLGGGIGVNFSHIRPRGTEIKGTGGVATGAVSLMEITNAVGDVIREGGGRRTALMFGLKYNHPDLKEFIDKKLDHDKINNANVSVMIDNNFLDLVENDEDVVFEWQGQEKGKMKARKIWKKIVENAWRCGDPGILNMGLANELNTISYLSDLDCSNPCGEQMLEPYGSCCLGSLVLPTHIIDGEMNWELLGDTITLAVRFLDNVIAINHYPIKEVEQQCQNVRRIGLGVMGLHDMLLRMGLKYDQPKALEFVDKLFAFIKKKSYESSIFLAVEKGQFPGLDREAHVKTGFCKTLSKGLRQKILEYGIRNCTINTIPPTGTTSIVAAVSSGIEPMFSYAYKRSWVDNVQDIDGKGWKSKKKKTEIVIHPLFQEFVTEGKSVKHFQSAHEIAPEFHLELQRICQKHIDNAITKTINVPSDITVEELSDTMLKYARLLKGITIYRDGSKGEAPLIPFDLNEAIKQAEKHKGIVASKGKECEGDQCEL